MGKAKRDSPPIGSEADRLRGQVARQLFDSWVGATNSEILTVLWHNLSPSDRQQWFDLADEQLTNVETNIHPDISGSDQTANKQPDE